MTGMHPPVLDEYLSPGDLGAGRADAAAAWRYGRPVEKVWTAGRRGGGGDTAARSRALLDLARRNSDGLMMLERMVRPAPSMAAGRTKPSASPRAARCSIGSLR